MNTASRSKASEAELRAEYGLTKLPAMGISFEKALQIPGIETTLNGAIRERRRKLIKMSFWNPIQYQVTQ